MAGSVQGEPKIRKRIVNWPFQTATVILGLYLLGFGAFLLLIPLPAGQMPATAKADGIVAVTGEISRLGPAVMLLEQERGERLLITGVNPATSRSELRRLLGGGARFDCCVDLGFAAADTSGNAAEAAMWARAHGYKSLIVVTADYHMPRSLLEFSAQMPEMRLTPYPVAPEQTELPLLRKLPRLLSEYTKYLASLTRHSLFRATPSPPVSP